METHPPTYPVEIAIWNWSWHVWVDACMHAWTTHEKPVPPTHTWGFQISKSGIILDLSEIIQFCLMDYDLWILPPPKGGCMDWWVEGHVKSLKNGIDLTNLRYFDSFWRFMICGNLSTHTYKTHLPTYLPTYPSSGDNHLQLNLALCFNLLMSSSFFWASSIIQLFDNNWQFWTFLWHLTTYVNHLSLDILGPKFLNDPTDMNAKNNTKRLIRIKEALKFVRRMHIQLVLHIGMLPLVAQKI